LNVHNGLISAVTGFVHPGLFRHFGLPAEPDLHGPADGNNVVGVA
jgi:hypothetical protein